MIMYYDLSLFWGIESDMTLIFLYDSQIDICKILLGNRSQVRGAWLEIIRQFHVGLKVLRYWCGSFICFYEICSVSLGLRNPNLEPLCIYLFLIIGFSPITCFWNMQYVETSTYGMYTFWVSFLTRWYTIMSTDVVYSVSRVNREPNLGLSSRHCRSFSRSTYLYLIVLYTCVF